MPRSKRRFTYHIRYIHTKDGHGRTTLGVRTLGTSPRLVHLPLRYDLASNTTISLAGLLTLTLLDHYLSRTLTPAPPHLPLPRSPQALTLTRFIAASLSRQHHLTITSAQLDTLILTHLLNPSQQP